MSKPILINLKNANLEDHIKQTYIFRYKTMIMDHIQVGYICTFLYMLVNVHIQVGYICTFLYMLVNVHIQVGYICTFLDVLNYVNDVGGVVIKFIFAYCLTFKTFYYD